VRSQGVPKSDKEGASAILTSRSRKREVRHGNCYFVPTQIMNPKLPCHFQTTSKLWNLWPSMVPTQRKKVVRLSSLHSAVRYRNRA
jgi:hypothetical protein